MDGYDGPARMAALMDRLRRQPPVAFGNEPIVTVGDYQSGVITEQGASRPTGMPAANMLYYKLQNGDVIIVRPSGTEPKVKFYFLLKAADATAAAEHLNSYRQTLDTLTK